jgi:hypothetical protein
MQLDRGIKFRMNAIARKQKSSAESPPPFCTWFSKGVWFAEDELRDEFYFLWANACFAVKMVDWAGVRAFVNIDHSVSPLGFSLNY